jgi:hypothetical protein
MASSTCKYDVSFEMRLSESKYPPGSESRCTSFANAESARDSRAGANDDAYAIRVAAGLDVPSAPSRSLANDPAMIVAGMAASSHRTERNLELIDTSVHAKILGVTGRGPVAES